MALPTTVTTLRCPNGSIVHIVGTAHFSPESVDDVRRTIRETKPATVVLELCPSRQMILHFSEEDILREARTMTYAKMRSIIRRDGLVAGITQSIFLRLSAELTQKLGVAPGGEFRAGFEEARQLSTCQVVLGDRNVGITFKRAMASLTLWQRIRFTFLLFRSMMSEVEITPEEVERMKTRDMVQLLMGEFGSEFPPLMQVFVSERDQILAYSLMRAANCTQQPYGPAVTVVGVMGMGHVPGVEANWMKEVEVQHLLTTPSPSRTSRVIGYSVRIGLLGACIAGVFIIGRRILLRGR